MLKELKIVGVASYAAEGERLYDLKEVNYIFGTNGSGKTTIARLIANPAHYPSCSLQWADGRPLDRIVYNSDFTAQNFASSTAPGIFTLGSESAETRASIVTARDQIGRLDDEIAGLEQKRDGENGAGGKQGELAALRSEIEDACWRYKTTHDKHFADAFEGLRNNKARFCDRMLSEHSSNEAETHSVDELKARALTVFEKGIGPLAQLQKFSLQSLIDLESSEILAKKIVGKEDVDIAALIKRLGNSDWVKQGIAYAEQSQGACPFCQQMLPHDLVDHLNDYFDETYLADMAEISRIATAYDTHASTALNRLEAFAAEDHRYLDTGLLKVEIARLSDRLMLNGRLIGSKRKEASTPITLDGISELSLVIKTLFDTANEAIRTHNQTVQNLDSERTRLISQIWKCIITEANAELSSYGQKKIALEQGIAGLTNGIAAKRKTRNETHINLAHLEESVTSVRPTVDQINGTLASFGFGNFRLATAEHDEGLYRILRTDGSDASQTLSEGEKGFM